MTEEATPKVEEKKLPSFVVEARMKEYIKSSDMHSTGDVVDAMNVQVAYLLDNAMRRCKQNGRTTVQARDV